MKAWRAFTAAALMLLALPAGVAAKSGFFVEKPQRWTEFSLPAANGYRVTVNAVEAIRRAPANISVTASRGQRYNVNYLARGRNTKDGAIDAELPGVGRIVVRFHPTKVTREAVADNCKGRSSVIRHGIFQGTIELHGELGYTTLHNTRATGNVTQSFRQVCDQRESEVGEGGSGGSSRETTLFAGTKEGDPAINFSAFLDDFGPKFGGPAVFFTASSSKRNHGLSVFSSVTVQGDPAEFSMPDPAGSLEDATVEPPPPFQGSATFHLDSSATSTWQGTLGVKLPGVGIVALAGPSFWSALCAENTCTETLPPNVHIAFFESALSAIRGGIP